MLRRRVILSNTSTYSGNGQAVLTYQNHIWWIERIEFQITAFHLENGEMDDFLMDHQRQTGPLRLINIRYEEEECIKFCYSWFDILIP